MVDSPGHEVAQDVGLIGTVPPEVGAPSFGPVGDSRPAADQGQVSLFGDAELLGVVPLPGVDDREHVAAGRPVLALRAHVGRVGRVELLDARFDLAPVDAAGLVDLIDVDPDPGGVLLIGQALEPDRAPGGRQVDDREHDGHRVAGHARRARGHRRGCAAPAGAVRGLRRRARGIVGSTPAAGSRDHPDDDTADDRDDDCDRHPLRPCTPGAQLPPEPADPNPRTRHLSPPVDSSPRSARAPRGWLQGMRRPRPGRRGPHRQSRDSPPDRSP